MCFVPDIRYACCRSSWRQPHDPSLPILELCPETLSRLTSNNTSSHSPETWPPHCRNRLPKVFSFVGDFPVPCDACSQSQGHGTSPSSSPSSATTTKTSMTPPAGSNATTTSVVTSTLDAKLLAVDRAVEDALAVTRSCQSLRWAQSSLAKPVSTTQSTRALSPSSSHDTPSCASGGASTSASVVNTESDSHDMGTLDTIARLREEAYRLETSVATLIGTLEWSGTSISNGPGPTYGGSRLSVGMFSCGLWDEDVERRQAVEMDATDTERDNTALGERFERRMWEAGEECRARVQAMAAMARAQHGSQLSGYNTGVAAWTHEDGALG